MAPHVGSSEHAAYAQEAVSWFREGRELLQREIELRFEQAHPNLPTAESLVAELPRTTAHRTHLLRGAQLPVEAFRGGGALEMLCYLSLQGLPRHSRVYANLHLSGGWHDQLELKGVYTAVSEHSPQLLQGFIDKQAKVGTHMNVTNAMAANDVQLLLAEDDDRAGEVAYDGATAKSATFADALGG